MLQTSYAEGFIEIEHDFVRFLKIEKGHNWVGKTISTSDTSLWSDLKKEVTDFFHPGTRLNFICSDQGLLRSMEFPKEATEAEIVGNLQLKRKEYFNAREEMLFKVRSSQIANGNNKDVFVSALPKTILDQSKNLCEETGCRLNRLTTSADALFGAFQRQLQHPVSDTCVILQVGYSRVHLLAVKGLELIAVRSLLTGSLKELENILFAGFSLQKHDVARLLKENVSAGVPAIDDAIRTNRLELMTHIGSLFSELRSKKLLGEKSVFYISNSMIDEPELGLMISERFGVSVEILTGLQNNEFYSSSEDHRSIWLSGASLPSVANLLPVVKKNMTTFSLEPRAAVLAALVLAIAPLPFLNFLKIQTANDLTSWKQKHVPVQTLVDSYAQAAQEQEKLITLAKEITADIDRRGLATRLTRHLTENLPHFTRLEQINVNLKNNRISVTGYTVDTESALRYLDAIKAFAELGEPEITIGDIESRRIKFDISAPLGKKG